MKEIEEKALAHNLTFHRLMENAGSAAAAFIRRTFQIEGLNCMIFCGGGGNGGDGFVVARKLFENGANVLVVLVGPPSTSQEPQAMFTSAQLMGIPMVDFAANQDKVLELVSQADIIVDAVCGIGFHGELDGSMREACVAINAAIAAVVALDIPSGVECDTGRCAPDAIQADFTVAFDSHKPAHILAPSQPNCGQVAVVEIGIPPEARQGIASRFGTLCTPVVLEMLPPREPDSHKGDHGHVLAICGSARYRGAAALSTLAALRSGAGRVTLASTETVCASVSSQIYEATFLPLLAGADGNISSELDLSVLYDAISSATAILLGCGLGQGEHARRLLRHILKNATCPVIVDADGINALSENINVIQEASVPVILTPHPGEMARLCQCSVAKIQADRSGMAMSLAKVSGAVVVLKGRETIIAGPDGGLLQNATGNPGLAKGGSGDVLAGMIAAFAGGGVEPVYAAACGVHLHGLAADQTAARRSQYAMLPSELLDDLAGIFAANGR